MNAEVFVILALSTVVAVGASQAAGAWLARGSFKRLNRLADEILSDPTATSDDRAFVASELKDSLSRWPIWLAALTAPLWCIPLFIFALVDARRFQRMSEEEALERFRKEREAIDRLHGKSEKPQHSQGFFDRQEAILDASFKASFLTSPFLSIWIALSFAPSLLAFAFVGAADVAVRRFRLVYEILLARLGAAEHRTA